jgi:hypothetical protein
VDHPIAMRLDGVFANKVTHAVQKHLNILCLSTQHCRMLAPVGTPAEGQRTIQFPLMAEKT